MTTGMVNPTLTANNTVVNAQSVQSPQGSEDFLATLMATLGGENLLGEAELLSNLFEAVGEEKNTQNNKNVDLTAAMELMSVMLFGAQNLAEQQTDVSEEIKAQLASVLADAQNKGNLAFEDSKPTLEQNGKTTELLETLMNASTQKTEQVVEVLSKIVQENNAVETVPKNSVELFENAIHLVKNRLGMQDTLQKTDEKANLDAMQSAVDNTHLNTTFAHQVSDVQHPVLPTATQIISQVKTGIVENFNTDKSNELIIKLRPEGLGEVTVKMVETAGKVSLSITTNSQYAQQAISNELNTLREALKPYNAEISQAVTYDAGNFSQGFGGQANHQQQQSKQQYFFDTEESAEDISSQQQYAQALGMALNQYV